MWHSVFFPEGKGSFLKEFPVETNCFIEVLTPYEKGSKNKDGRVSSPESVRTHLITCYVIYQDKII